MKLVAAENEVQRGPKHELSLAKTEPELCIVDYTGGSSSGSSSHSQDDEHGEAKSDGPAIGSDDSRWDVEDACGLWQDKAHWGDERCEAMSDGPAIGGDGSCDSEKYAPGR